MKSIEERLSDIFSNQEFLEANKDLDNFESVYAAVKERDTEVTKAELQDYLCLISEHLHSGELSEDQLEDVAGGFGVLAMAGAIGAVCGAIAGCTGIGYGIGRFIYHCRQ